MSAQQSLAGAAPVCIERPARRSAHPACRSWASRALQPGVCLFDRLDGGAWLPLLIALLAGGLGTNGYLPGMATALVVLVYAAAAWRQRERYQRKLQAFWCTEMARQLNNATAADNATLLVAGSLQLRQGERLRSEVQFACRAFEQMTLQARDQGEEQSQRLAMIATASEQIDQTLHSIDALAQDALAAFAEANRQSDVGCQQAREVGASMVGIQHSLGSTAQAVEALLQRTADVEKTVESIRTLARQTQLLALNASIEAARAGEHGRGFAVVADEVRALAHRTQQSTAEIEQMITSIQAGTGKAVNAMSSSSERAKASLQVAEAAGQALVEINAAIVLINERNLGIASATEEQAQVAREVDRNLTSIRDLSMQSSAAANQTSAASSELSQLAVGLNQVVLKFRV